MAEVLVEFSEPITDVDGITYIARACGAEVEGGHWHGWIEFIPQDGGLAFASPRETTQPNRTDTVYWATGLTPVYLEGALHRALQPAVHHVPRTTSILNPFSAYRNGEDMLRRRLNALSSMHLINIIVAHQLSSVPAVELQQLPEAELAELIIMAVRERSMEPTIQ
jgi:hypothetical protein